VVARVCCGAELVVIKGEESMAMPSWMRSDQRHKRDR
jgi:hypothetical protein